MNELALLRAHTRVSFLDLIRWPGYVVPTVLFPAMFYVLFDLPFARRHAEVATATTLAFIAFAVVGVSLYQFGVGIAQERGRPWERFLRTLPANTAVRFGARIATAMIFALLAAGLVAIVARLLTPVDLNALQWLRVAAFTLCGGIPFVLMGIALGYWASARAAVPLATACNLLLAYGGGLWMPPDDLPGFVAKLSPYLPTRQFADLLWSVTGSSHAGAALTGLGLYTLVFAIVAVIGYRRDEQRRYA
ncbi:MAG: ABC transporter permease [Candidatus Eremiobacteraeota bacterium]|nr:ABC transporter permease [Candidatus Eremiobacteraeota bacterium]